MGLIDDVLYAKRITEALESIASSLVTIAKAHVTPPRPAKPRRTEFATVNVEGVQRRYERMLRAEEDGVEFEESDRDFAEDPDDADADDADDR